MKVPIEAITLARSNQRPLSFRGHMLAAATTKDQNNSTRWHEAEVYRTTHNRVVVYLRSLTQWQGESDHDTAHVCEPLYGHGGEAAAIDWIEDNFAPLAPELAGILHVTETLAA